MWHTIVHTWEHILVTNLNEHLDKNPSPAPASDNTDSREHLEVETSWFKLRLEDINVYSLTAIAMILTAVVAIVWIVSQ